MHGVGQQMICEFWGASNLDSVETTERALRDAVRAGGATLVEIFVHRFSPHGISGIAVIAESHLAVHTWPELGYCAADFFTCGDSVDMNAIVRTLRDAYNAERADVRTLARGVPPVAYESATFRDTDSCGPPIEYAVDTILEQRVTRHRELLLFESNEVGTVLALDGSVRTTDLDSAAYYETLVHPAMHAHPNPRDIAIVGGIDLHSLALVLQHNVSRVELIETDEETLRIADKYYDHVQGSLDDPRVTVHTGNVIATLAELRDVDCVLIDPVRRGEIFSISDFETVVATAAERLRPNGIFVMPLGPQSGSVSQRQHTVATISDQFRGCGILWAPSGVEVGALSLFAIASRELDVRQVNNDAPGVITEWYSADAHVWSFLPPAQRARLIHDAISERMG